MKLEKITHDHLLTKWLKVIIFAILMLAPIFSVAVRCAYVVCNKNAYLSYYGETINNHEDRLLTNLNQFELNKTYMFNSNTKDTTGITFPKGAYAYVMNVSNVNIIDTNYTDLIEFNKIGLYLASNGDFSVQFANDETTQVKYFTGNNFLIFSFQYEGNNLNFDFTTIDIFYEVIYNDYSYLDNVFDYSVAQLQQDQLFNWTQQTGVYTGVNAMTTGLGLTDGTISILITYWTLLSIIYVIIDIVLEGFVALTHMILKKAS